MVIRAASSAASLLVVGALVTVAFLVLGSAPAIAQPQAASPEIKAFTVRTPDGVMISAQEWGNPSGPEILLIHGLSQSHLSWLRQVKSDLAKTFRMITYDIRGHGGSDKPLDPAYYKDQKRWADEVQAVIEGARLKKPVLVGWSYGGRIIVEYLMHYSDKSIAGINFVAAVTKSAPEFLGPATPAVRKMVSEDLAENIENTLSFLRFSTAKALPAEEFEMMVGYNMVVPAKVRLHMLARPTLYGGTLKKINVPVLVTHGTEDRVILSAMGRYTASVVPNAKTSFYEGIGHMPFWEEPARFNRELAEFVTISNRR